MPRHPSLVPLSHDHREALGLAFFLHNPAPPGRVTAMTPASTPETRRERLLAFYDDRLRVHFRAEEEALFPALPAARQDLVAALVADHRRFAALREAVVRAAAGEGLERALAAFADLLEAHVRREERELFAGFPDGVGDHEARRIGEAVAAVLATRAPARCDL